MAYFQVPGEVSYSQDAVYDGRAGNWSYLFGSLEDARAYVNSLRDGSLDPFLREAWTNIEVFKPRDSQGRFMAGWVVQVDIVRPDY